MQASLCVQKTVVFSNAIETKPIKSSYGCLVPRGMRAALHENCRQLMGGLDRRKWIVMKMETAFDGGLEVLIPIGTESIMKYVRY